MRVCILCPGWPGKVNPWNGIFIKEQATNLSNLNCDVSVVTARVFKQDPPFQEDGKIKIHRFWFPSQRKLLAEYEKIPVVRIGFYLVSAILRALRVARKDRSDLIHAHWAIPMGFVGVIVGKYLLRKPVVLTAHDMDISTFPDKSRIARRLIGFALERAQIIISVSETVKEEILKRFRVDGAKIKVIPLGIDRTLFKPMDQREMRERLGLPQDRKIILFIGALQEIKGVKHLMGAIPEVVAAHPNVLFLLVGSGPLQSELGERIDRLGLMENVRLLGSKPHQEIPLWLGAADALILPSLSEAFGIVNAEALAMGIPVIASRIGGIPEVVEDGRSGLLIEPGSSQAIAEALDSILKGAGRLACLREGATLKPEYDTQVSAKRVRETYLSLLKQA